MVLDGPPRRQQIRLRGRLGDHLAGHRRPSFLQLAAQPANRRQGPRQLVGPPRHRRQVVQHLPGFVVEPVADQGLQHLRRPLDRHQPVGQLVTQCRPETGEQPFGLRRGGGVRGAVLFAAEVVNEIHATVPAPGATFLNRPWAVRIVVILARADVRRQPAACGSPSRNPGREVSLHDKRRAGEGVAARVAVARRLGARVDPREPSQVLNTLAGRTVREPVPQGDRCKT
jgi:hypothetical protein